MNGTALTIEQVGMNVRVARVMAGFKSDAEFAKKIGMSKQNLSQRMVGSVRFKEEEKKKIAEITGKDQKDLFGLEE